ncbi:MAG TPA: glycosyltransferase family 4 protein [Candidatus Binatia bacterium]|nr:glycosyltransferase family 4 protein [Candidatus Binatia bacterium]
MRVLHVIDKSFLGGGQSVVRNLIAGSRETGVATALACRGGGPLVGAARALGAPVFEIPFDKRFRPGPARALARAASQHGADVVHAHGLVATFYCVLARGLFGMRRPILYHQHGFHHHNYGALSVGLRRAIERAVCRRVERVVACSRADVDQLARERYAPADRLRLVYYGIPEPAAPADVVARRRAEAGLASGQPVVGTIARLHPQKGVDVFLRAAARIARARPDAAFMIVGTGEIEEELKRLGAGLGLDGELRWMGGRPSAEFLPLLTVDVISSRWEGLPFTLLEAMASARSIVTTDVPGCLEAVGDQEASIVPRDDPERMADAVLDLLSRPDAAARSAAAARRRWEQRFTLKEMVRRVDELYAELAL